MPWLYVNTQVCRQSPCALLLDNRLTMIPKTMSACSKISKGPLNSQQGLGQETAVVIAGSSGVPTFVW